MKTLGQHAVVARILGQGLVLATLCATVLSAPGIAWAQSKPVQTEPSAALGQAARQAPPATQPTPSAATGEPAPKGAHEGIKVHGHWTIEVRNPDGTLAARREFENSLSSGLTLAGDAVSGGSSLLSAIITGQALTPVTWGILLEGPNFGTSSSTTGAPCPNTTIQVGTTLQPNSGACILLQTDPSSWWASAYNCSTSTTSTTNVSCNLTPTPLGTAPNYTGFLLAGSVTAAQPGTISAVATLDGNACGANPPLSCIFHSTFGVVAFTSTALNGSPGTPTAPVSVTAAGQTISVTVQLSFQ